ncbi:MAG: hypothetical protein IT328_20205 [Caldilineaceae bacterium]|nr:hypothetical protein [Caldilineaceae bacterium]
MTTKTEETKVEAKVEAKPFSKAELAHIKEKAMAANVAIQAHREFVEFLREQHEAPEDEGWMLGPKGFELRPTPPDGAQGEQDAGSQSGEDGSQAQTE